MKSGLIRGVASLERDNLVIFYYLNACKIRPDKRSGLYWEWPAIQYEPPIKCGFNITRHFFFNL
jgi:hypothetical protein